MATTGAQQAAADDTSPNGLIAYSAWDDAGNYDIYVVDPAQPDVPPVKLTTDGRYNSNPDWSPDGTKIAFDGWSDVSGPRIQVMDADPATPDQTVLTVPCVDSFDCYGDFQPEWSPDGTRIAFVSSRPNADGSPNWSYELYVMDATGEVGAQPPATRLTTDPLPEFGQGINDSQVTWSPDGTRLAFVSQGRSDVRDTCDLWTMDSQDADGDGFGDNLERITFDDSYNCDAFEDTTPEWSPDSSVIAFTSTRSGYFDIWLVNADDPTDLRNVTQTPGEYEDQPSWSPDGTQIIFRSSKSGAYEYYSLPVPPPGGETAGGLIAAEPTQLTFDGQPKRQGDWGTVAKSRPGTAVLSVDKRGAGTVTSAPAKIHCGKVCAATFVAKTKVHLAAHAKPGWQFKRWTGACRGSHRACDVRMGVDRKVGAKFVRSAVVS